ncbi:hypothetical protein [Embleya sp. NPDC059237]|uniref:hypothetical protein n=1 Tax=Embleya sp. NPDC059237 TaxID=3346784 RepID=UPI003698CF48
MRAVLANWIQPVIHGTEIRWIPSNEQPGRDYWTIAVPRSVQAPHGFVGAEGNDMSFRFPVRPGTTTADEAHIHTIRHDGDADLDPGKHWIAVAMVPTTCGSIPLTTRFHILSVIAASMADRAGRTCRSDAGATDCHASAATPGA